MSEVNILGKTIKISATGGTSALNTDKLTVAACSKVFGDLYNTLIQKGVSETDISADNPTGLVDAVKALPTNTVGGIRRDFPMALIPYGITQSSDSFFTDVVDDYYFRKQTNSSQILIFDLREVTWDETCKEVDGGGLKINVNKTALQAAVKAAGLEVTLGDIYMKAVPESLNIVYYSSSGHAGVITPNLETNTITATCVALTQKEGALKTLPTSSQSVWATNGQKLLLKGYNSQTRQWLIDLTTGVYDTQNWGFVSSIVYSGDYGFDSQYHNGFWFGPNGANLAKVKINWNDLEQTYALNTQYANKCYYGFKGNYLYTYTYNNGIHYLGIEDLETNVKITKTITTESISDSLLFAYSYSYPSNCRKSLIIETLENGYTQIFVPFGFILLDADNNFIKPIAGANYIGTFIVNEKSKYPKDNYIYPLLPFKYNGKYYLLSTSTSSGDIISIRNGLVGVYYGKAVANVYNHNEQILVYPYWGIINKSVMDGTTLDADTVSISVDVSGLGESEAA